MNDWKQKGLAGHQRYLDRTAKEAADKRAEELKKYQETVSYVEARTRELNRKHQRNVRHNEQAEADRIELRKLQREERRAKRIAGYETRERAEMSIEDKHSAQYRFFMWETARILEERENMWNEECDQTEVDNFWGFPTDARRQAEERDRLKKIYDDHVEVMRVKCVEAQLIRPTEWEVSNKVYKDFYSNKTLK